MSEFMELALALAERGLGRTSPNPPVGAVLVRDGRVIGEGFHCKAGLPHAEVEAIADAASRGNDVQGATLFCTLEPCCHTGRTGPCTEAIIRAGISQVVFGCTDPNPKVSGRGAAALRAAGIEVTTGVLEERCRDIIRFFAKHVTTAMPFVTMKAATSLDGKLTAAHGESRWISCEESREAAHRLRDQHDAVMVGIGTALRDNPRLTCRIPEGRSPVRVVVDSSARLPPDASMLHETGRTIVAVTEHAPLLRAEALAAAGAEVLLCDAVNGRVSLKDLLGKLGQQGIASVLLEGGSELNAAMLAEGLVDRVLLFVAPLLIGGDAKGLVGGETPALADALRLTSLSVRRSGADILVEARP